MKLFCDFKISLEKKRRNTSSSTFCTDMEQNEVERNVWLTRNTLLDNEPGVDHLSASMYISVQCSITEYLAIPVEPSHRDHENEQAGGTE